MLPVIEFKRSKVYEKGLLNLSKKHPIAKLEESIFLEIFEKLKAETDTLTKILEAITKILKVDWQRKSIRVYTLAFREHGTTFSEPLTISLCTSKGEPAKIENLIDLITHELIHNALTELPETRNAIKKLEKTFPNLEKDAYSHILVHSVHYLIYEKIRGLKRYEIDKQKVKNKTALAQAWEIAETYGAQAILKKYLLIK